MKLVLTVHNTYSIYMYMYISYYKVASNVGYYNLLSHRFHAILFS